jgi:tRNA(Ile)-lysidine synthase TilS/MesJ
VSSTKLQASLEQKVLAFIRENILISAGEKVLVAVSGGPDSICLLYILYNLRKELGIKLHIAHLNCGAQNPKLMLNTLQDW